jgi:FixJ family two-component response regulator
MSETPTPVVHLVDDDESSLTAVSRLLRLAGYSVKTFSSAPQLLDQLTFDARGCIIADLQMPEISGLELQDALAAARIEMPIIILSGHGDIPSTVRAMRHGAEDFLTKRAPKAELLAAVKRALDRDARQHADRARQRAIHSRLDALTAREREVLEEVVRGSLNKQIASKLEIHERTVKLHRTSITTKLGVHSVAELTRLTLAAGSAEPSSTTPSA